MDFFLNILIAALLGGAIGLEREYRAKEAGFRTHFLVALGAALFMILSAHGFEGVLTTENHRLDVSRIAAQVVSGIGFIGAGTIIFQKHAVRGLTTAAGLWVTAAIGMAAGAGLFLLSTATTLLVLLCLEAQNVLLRRLGHRHLDITFAADTREDVDRVLQHLNTLDGVIADSLNMETATAPQPRYTVKLQLRLQRRQFRHRILDFIGEMKGVDVLNIE
jgi:putative Mg2+ transporter-C (MgtC) family protein